MPALIGREPATTADGVLALTAELVEAGRLVRGTFLLSDGETPENMKGLALCGGNRGCLVGDLWLAAGVPVERSDLPTARPHLREAEFRRRPHLRRAYKALDREALATIRADADISSRDDENWREHFPFAAERYLEVHKATDDDIVELIARARRRLRRRWAAEALARSLAEVRRTVRFSRKTQPRRPNDGDSYRGGARRRRDRDDRPR